MTTWVCLGCEDTGTTAASEKRHREASKHATLTGERVESLLRMAAQVRGARDA